MGAKKVFALFAVIIMITCPLAVVMADTDGASQAEARDQGTYISLKDMNKDELEEIFFHDVNVEANYTLSELIAFTVPFSLAMVAIPDLNIYPFMEIIFDQRSSDSYTPTLDDVKWDVSGVDLEISYYREVTTDKQYDLKFSVDINVRDFSITFSENLMKEVNSKMKTWAQSDIGSSMLLSDYTDTQLEKIIESFFGKKDTYLSSDSLRSSIISALLVKLMKASSTGDYSSAIRETYSGKIYGANPLKLTGSSHTKLFIECGSTVEKISVPSSNAIDYVYVVLNSGINPATKIFIGNAEDKPLSPLVILKLLSALSIKKVSAEMESLVNIDQIGLPSSSIKSNVALDFRFDRTFNYETDLNSMISAMTSGKSLEKFKEKTRFMADADIVLKFNADAEFIVDGKGHSNNGYSMDLSDQLMYLFDNQQGYAADGTPSTDCMYPFRNILPSTTWGGNEATDFGFKDLFDPSSDFFDWGYNDIIIFVEYYFIESHNANVELITESEAKELIEFYGGECSHDAALCKKAADSVNDSITGSGNSGLTSEQSMKIVMVVIGVLVILAIIALAIFIKNKYYY